MAIMIAATAMSSVVLSSVFCEVVFVGVAVVVAVAVGVAVAVVVGVGVAPEEDDPDDVVPSGISLWTSTMWLAMLVDG